MGRGNYKYFEQADFRGGFCLEPENARPNQLLTAKNVWAPEGRLETRPGFVGITSYIDATTSGLSWQWIEETVVTGSQALMGGHFAISCSASEPNETYVYYGLTHNYTNRAIFKSATEATFPLNTIDAALTTG